MTRVLQALLISLPLLVAGVVVLVRRRRGERLTGMYLLGLLGIVAMAGFWWYYAGVQDGGPEAAWFVGLVAALIAVVVAASPRWGARTVLASAVVAPFALLAFTAGLYAFGEGAIRRVRGSDPVPGHGGAQPPGLRHLRGPGAGRLGAPAGGQPTGRDRCARVVPGSRRSRTTSVLGRHGVDRAGHAGRGGAPPHGVSNRAALFSGTGGGANVHGRTAAAAPRVGRAS